MTLIRTVQKDILTFIEENEELFFNERDFQMHLALYLRNTNRYDDVDVEYYVPYQELGNYVWESELRLDIVVRKGEEYVPVELKYKTKKVEKSFLRFEENIHNAVIMKNQGAQDIGRYDFWKDVRRVELVHKRFSQVIGGVAVFLTNDNSYLRMPKEQSIDYLFSMSEGKHSIHKHWADTTRLTLLNFN